MADLLCCSQRVYSNYERGEVDIPSRVWVELAKFHGTSVDYLMELTDQKEPYPERKKKMFFEKCQPRKYQNIIKKCVEIR